jgi:hypothetical protein
MLMNETDVKFQSPEQNTAWLSVLLAPIRGNVDGFGISPLWRAQKIASKPARRADTMYGTGW